jgi:uncharacterized protein YjbI with pentapeptide repeats
MSDGAHIDIVALGVVRINAFRIAEPNVRFDLSGATLSGVDLRGANLSGANLSNTKFERADLSNANLQSALLDNAKLQAVNLSGANLTSANLTNANLLEARIDHTTNFSNANLDQAKVDKQLLIRAELTGAVLTNRDFSGLDFSHRDLSRINFGSSDLMDADFTGAKMHGVTFANAKLQGAKLINCDLTRANLSAADLNNAKLMYASFSRAILDRAILAEADISGADFFEAQLNLVSFKLARGVPKAQHLLTTKISSDVQYFSTVIRELPERLLDWEKIRVAGRLPLFGASYAGLIVIPTYVYILQIYNQNVEAARTWISAHTATNGLSEAATERILTHLHTEHTPDSFFLLFISTIALAIAATIYAIACPSRVKEFSRDQWCDQFGHSLVHYWPDAWKGRWLRLVCAFLYITGGIGAGYVLIQKLYYVGMLLYHSPTAI